MYCAESVLVIELYMVRPVEICDSVINNCITTELGTTATALVPQLFKDTPHLLATHSKLLAAESRLVQ